MIFRHDNSIKKDGCFSFSQNIKAVANKSLAKDIFKELWYGYTFRCSELDILKIDEFVFRIGEADSLLVDEKEYAINIEQNGLCVSSKTEKGLIHGFMTLLDLIKMSPSGEALEIDCCEIKESPIIKNQMIHYCVFAQTELWELENFIRACGVMKYTHIVLEFWGMYKYECLNELSWKHGYTKEQLKPIIDMAKDMGLEIIPMINHWGHASAGRVMHGKHVVLNQNPALQYYFSEDGWCWNFKNEKTRALLKEMRREICDLCGNGEYFHIGCDEAYCFEFTEENINSVAAYINETAKELKEQGRKTVMWGDMLLCQHEEYNKNNTYFLSCPDKKSEECMMDMIDKDIVIADWQYTAYHVPVETAVTLKNAGFTTMLCSWDTSDTVRSCTQTIKKEKLFGIMHTTWDTLSKGMPEVYRAAVLSWEEYEEKYHLPVNIRTKAAAAYRKTNFAGGDYEKSGWSKYEIGIIT